MAPFSLLPLPGGSLPSPGRLHCLPKNLVFEIGALQLALPGAPTPTELTSKLSPANGCQDRPQAQGHLWEAKPG